MPVAALVALVVGAALLGSIGTTTTVKAGSTDFSLSIDCDTSTVGIQSSCTFPSGTTTVDVHVVLSNDSGSASDVGAVNFEVIADQAVLTASTSGSGFDYNPDFNENEVSPFLTGTWQLLPAPEPDCATASCTYPGDNTRTDSFISAFNTLGDGPALADGATIVLATIHYNVASEATSNVGLETVAIGDNFGTELMSCNPVLTNAGTCTGATVQIGTGGLPDTATPTATTTNTPVPTATCVGAACPTRTPLAFVTVTFTPSATVPATATPGAPGEPPPPPPGGSNPPPTGSGPGGRPGGTITLPDTGTGTEEQMDWRMAALIALAALGAGGLAGGATLALNGRRSRD